MTFKLLTFHKIVAEQRRKIIFQIVFHYTVIANFYYL